MTRLHILSVSTLTVFILCFYSINAAAQTTISGTVLDESGSSLPTANVLLLHPADSSVVKGAVTDDSGFYELNSVKPGKFLLSVSMIGFRRFVSSVFEVNQNPVEFNAITLQVSLEQMEEVDVTARRPLFEQKIDRLVVNVQSSITSSGSSVLQVLEKSPGVQVNRQSNIISLSGKSGVRVMINDKFVRLPIDALVQMLNGMSAANIEQIELITTPPARYDAEGDAGIIHIKMTEFSEMGTTGTVGLNAGHNYAETLGGNFNISRRVDKLAMFLDYTINYDRTQNNWNNERSLETNNFIEEVRMENTRKPSISNQNARMGIEYKLGQKTTAGLLLAGNQRHWKTRDLSENFKSFTPSSSLLTEMSVRETNRWTDGMINLSLDHTFNKNRSLHFDADYLYYKNDNPSFYVNSFVEGDISRLENESIDVEKETPIHIRVVKLDYIHELSDKFTLETGAKGALSDFRNMVSVLNFIQNTWIVNGTFSQDANLSEKTGALYLSGSWKPGETVGVNAGLRYEYTDRLLSTPDSPGLVDVQDGYLFPTLFIQKSFPDEKSVGFSYSRRITRPNFNDLAPFVFFLDPITFLSGNPDLNPAISDALKIDYNHKQFLLSLQYSYTRDGIVSFQPEINQNTNEQVYKTQNLDYFRTYAINTSLPVYFSTWWEMRANVSGQYQVFRTAHMDDNHTRDMYSYSANITHMIDIPREFSLEVSGYYQSKRSAGLLRFKPQGALNIGIQKRIASDRGTIRLSVDDLFYTDLMRYSTNVPSANLDSRGEYDYGSRNIKLSFTWNFGNSQIQSVEVKTGSQEEQSRVSN
jgi:outer membrane receptor for ferrienterochelin and colicin